MKRALGTVAVCLAISLSAQAGTGIVRDENGVKLLDFCISVRFDASQAQIDFIEQVLERGSEVLADATDGQLRFGNVAIFEQSQASSEAEIWIKTGTKLASASHGGYGVRGEHITMFYSSNFSGSGFVERNGYTMAHEMAHHLWDVLDEYNGPNCVKSENCMPALQCCDCEPYPGGNTTTYCLMDDYRRRGGNLGTVDGGTYTLDEFCVTSNHDPDHDSGQDSVHGEPCWLTIAGHPTRPLTPPEDFPIAAAPSIPAPGFDPLVATNRYVLVIDRSGSMGTADAGNGVTRLFRAQQAAEIFVNLTEVGDRLGVVSFADEADPDFGLSEVTGDTVKDAAINAIGGLVSGGDTAIGEGLIDGRDLVAPLSPSCNQPLVLCTDGFGNVGPDELTVVPSLIQNRIPTTTVAIGASVSSEKLIEIANRTGGKFYRVKSAEDLPGLYTLIYAELSGGSVIEIARDTTVVPVQPVEVEVDALTGVATFVLSWSDPLVDLDLALLDPGGTFIDESTAATDPDVDFRAGRNHEILRVRGVAGSGGTWQLFPSGPAGAQFDMLAISDTPEISLAAMTQRPVHGCGETITLRATPRFGGEAITGAGPLSATVERPDGGQTQLTLTDDGDLGVGDAEADDGTYSAVLADPDPFGAHSFVVQVDNVGGETYAGESVSPGTAAVDPTSPFSRIVRTAAVTNCVSVNPGSVPDGNLVPGMPLLVGRSPSGGLELSWGPSCSPATDDYEVYEGRLGRFYNHLPLTCSTGGATTSAVPAAAHSAYYIVVPRARDHEGSHGRDGNGRERPPGEQTCLVRQVADCP